MSIEVSRISPAPRSTASSRPRDRVERRAACRPAVRDHLAAAGVDRADDGLGAELVRERGQQLRVVDRGPVERRPCPRLRAAARGRPRASAIPPPTVKGISSSAAARSTSSSSGRRPSTSRGDVEEDQLVGAELRVAARRARPGRRPRAASSKLTPLTTRPLATSRQGIRRFLTMRSAFSRRRAPGGAAALRVELDAGDRAAARPRRRSDRRGRPRRSRPSALPGRRRTSARSRRPRRRARRGATLVPADAERRSSPCAARAAPAGERPGPARTPRPRPPSSLSLEQELHADADPEHAAGRPSTRSRSASARPPRASARAARAGVADAGDHGQRRLAHRRRVGADRSAPRRPARAPSRRCAGCPHRSRRGRRSQRPFRRPGRPAAGAQASRERAAERLERRLGDVVVVGSRRLDVQRDAACIANRSSACGSSVSARPPTRSPPKRERDLGMRAADEVDSGRRPRLVHRHGCRAVPA